MATTKPGKLKAKAPSSLYERPLAMDLSAIFKAVGKGIGHAATGKWAELGADVVDGLVQHPINRFTFKGL